MGMAASQARLLSLTDRKADNELQTMRLSNQKVALTNEMNNVTKDYQNALSSKVLKWSNNSGVTCTDLSYSNMMRPNALNKYEPYLITDSNGMVVVDDKYKQYAEMISESGAGKGDWESVRTKVLSSLIGIDEATIRNYESASVGIIENKSALEQLEKSKPVKKCKSESLDNLLKKMNDGTGVNNLGFSSGSNFAQAYSGSATITVGSTSNAEGNLTKIFDNLKDSLGKYFADKKDIFEAAVDSKKEECIGLLGSDLSNSAGMLKGTSTEYKLDVKETIDEILALYAFNGGETGVNAYNNSDTYVWYDVDTQEYKNWEADYKEWETKYNAAQKNYSGSISSEAEALTSDQEKQIAFYDKLFSTIAENGWVYNDSVGDDNYLNQMLQNNIYTITTVDRTSTYDDENKAFKWSNEYSTDIATNSDNIVTVRDTDASNEALVEYEHKKSIINAKEKRIDARMKTLETELSAINQMIQGIESVRNDNIERTFGIFG